VLKEARTELFCYVPDAGIEPFIRIAPADNMVRTVVLTTERKALAFACGAWLGRRRGAVDPEQRRRPAPQRNAAATRAASETTPKCVAMS
jgi:hypothetical protein